MIAKLLRLALHQRFLSILLGIVLVGVGVWAFNQLSIEAYPDSSDTQVVVITVYPGHAAEEIEQQVSVPIERALNSVPNVIARRSRTIFGLSVVELTFEYGTNDYFARQLSSKSCATRRCRTASRRRSDRCRPRSGRCSSTRSTASITTRGSCAKSRTGSSSRGCSRSLA